MSDLQRSFFALAMAAALVGCAADEPPEDCGDAAPGLPFRNGRNEVDLQVRCPDQCPKGTKATRVECAWQDCSRVFFCVPESDGGAPGR
jgi:hypothetical protein